MSGRIAFLLIAITMLLILIGVGYLNYHYTIYLIQDK